MFKKPTVHPVWSHTVAVSVVLHFAVPRFYFAFSSGAKCEANTFDGERCLYGSLNESIRRLLKDYKCVGAHTMQRDDYEYFLHM